MLRDDCLRCRDGHFTVVFVLASVVTAVGGRTIYPLTDCRQFNRTVPSFFNAPDPNCLVSS
jgi:hypothetical protein